MWNDLVLFAGIVVGVLGIYFLVNFLRKKGYFDKDNLDNTKKVLEIAELIYKVLRKGIEKESTFLFDLGYIVVDYIYKTMDDNVDKKVISLEVIKEILNKFNKTPTEDEWKLIEFIVSEAIGYYEKRYKNN